MPLLGILVFSLRGVSSQVGLLLAMDSAISEGMSLCLALMTVKRRFVPAFGCCVTVFVAVAAVQRLPSRV